MDLVLCIQIGPTRRMATLRRRRSGGVIVAVHVRLVPNMKKNDVETKKHY